MLRVPDTKLRNMALFLDIDGTLLDIATRPGSVGIPQGLDDTLARLFDRTGGAVALVTGRALVDVDRLFAGLVLPAAGQHGAELRDARGRISRFGVARDALDRVRAAIAAEFDADARIVIEDKGMSLALHYRQARERSAEAAALASDLVAREPDLDLIPGPAAIEIKPRGVSKGTAVERFMSEAPFRGRLPTFIGDDLTDEDGFAVASRLGGYAIRIGAAPSATAPWFISSPVDLRAWLAELAGGT